jgi:hypothetical protein
MRNIANKYKAAAANNGGDGTEDWNNFVKRLRQIDADQAAAWGDKPKNTGGPRHQNHPNAAGGAGGQKSAPAAPGAPNDPRQKIDSYKRTPEQFKLIKSKRVCARCLKSGHMPNETPNQCPLKGKPMAVFKAKDLASLTDFTGPRPAEDAENYVSPT